MVVQLARPVPSSGPIAGVMLLAGVTDLTAEAEKIAALAQQIAPARTQINTATRPPVEGFVRPVPEKRMAALKGVFWVVRQPLLLTPLKDGASI
jgi:hypothetical protein